VPASSAESTTSSLAAAAKRGIKVLAPKESRLFEPPEENF